MQRIAPPVILGSFIDTHLSTLIEQELIRIIMALSSEQKKAYKRIAHHLKPVVIVSEQGASEGVLAELDRALSDHELIKIRITVGDRETKQALIGQLCQAAGAELVQVIGKMVVLLRRNKKPNPNLSNLVRFKDF